MSESEGDRRWLPMRLVETSLGLVHLWGYGIVFQVTLFDTSGHVVKEDEWIGESVAEALVHVVGVPAAEAEAIQARLASEGWPPDEGDPVADVRGRWLARLIRAGVFAVLPLALVGLGFLIWLVVDALA